MSPFFFQKKEFFASFLFSKERVIFEYCNLVVKTVAIIEKDISFCCAIMLSFLSGIIERGKCDRGLMIEEFKFSSEEHTIIDVETRDQMFQLFIDSGGEDTLFRTQDGYIWSITIYYDRESSKRLNSDGAYFISPNASDCNGYPINSDYPIDSRYLCSSSTFKEDSFDTYWLFHEFDRCPQKLNDFLGDKYLVATVLNNSKRPTCFIDTLEKHDRFNCMFVKRDNNSSISVDWELFYTHFNSLVMYKTFHYNISSHYDFREITVNFEKGEYLCHTRLLSEDEIDQIYIKNGKQPLFNELINILKDECESAHDKISDYKHYSCKESDNFNNLYTFISDDASDIKKEHIIQKNKYAEELFNEAIINLSKFAKTKLLIKILLNFDDMDSIEKFNQMVDAINLAYQTIYDFEDIVLRFDVTSINNGYDACKVILKKYDEGEIEDEDEDEA